MPIPAKVCSQDFRTKIYIHLTSPQFELHALPISSSLILSPWQCCIERSNNTTHSRSTARRKTSDSSSTVALGPVSEVVFVYGWWTEALFVLRRPKWLSHTVQWAVILSNMIKAIKFEGVKSVSGKSLDLKLFPNELRVICIILRTHV